MKVLLVMTARQCGGAELYVERLAAALGPRCRFTIVAPPAPDLAALLARLEAAPNVEAVLRLPFDAPRRLPGALHELRRLAKSHDVTHVNSNHPASRLGIAAGFALAGRRWVSIEQRGTPVDDVRVPRTVAWALPALYRWSRRSAAAVVAVSEENRRTLTGAYGLAADKVKVVYNGADLGQVADPAAARPGLRRELGLPDTARIVLVLARVLPNKGHRFLVDAAPAILAAHPDVHFVFAGALDDPAPVEERIAARGLAARFSLLGFRTDSAELLAASDVFVLPSLGEGFALTILEALVAGLPVVATAVGGAPEIIEDGRNGFLSPPADPAALEAAVTRALSLDPAARQTLAARARLTAERFSVSAMAERMLDVYRTAARSS